jgi:hypothetical protein
LQDLSQTVVLLARTPPTLNALLRDLSDSWTLRNEGDETWNVYDVIGHLNHGERADWIPRVRRILESGETCPFEPFDRLAQFRESEADSILLLDL